MTPPAALLDEHCDGSTIKRPLKKQKIGPSIDQDSEQLTAVQRHPLGVRPSGNAFTSKSNLKASCGIYALLPDEVLAQLLEYLEATDLLKLGATCRALHAFTRAEDLWKTLFVE